MSQVRLFGLETEYGLFIEGRGAETQLDDSMALVRGYPHQSFSFWDYRHESPRKDIRGFTAEALSVDPVDAQFDEYRKPRRMEEERADRILPNGARFYNDHGHPEYATPECASLTETVLQDLSGEFVLREAARAHRERVGDSVRIYKNNTDYHGASYGTHENYLVARDIPLQHLILWMLPALVCRQLLSGSGKVGSDSKTPADFQLSQRADFFTEVCSVDTLYKRPIFNTRDEPHSDETRWRRIHVICGDANQMPSNTFRKMGWALLAIQLAELGDEPPFVLQDPVSAFHAVSRYLQKRDPIPLSSGSWTDAPTVLRTYLDHACKRLNLNAEMCSFVEDCYALLDNLQSNGHPHDEEFATKVEWAAKLGLMEDLIRSENLNWSNPILKSVDLEFTHIDPDNSLYHGMLASGMVEPETDEQVQARNSLRAAPATRAAARAAALTKFGDRVWTASWGSVVIDDGQQIGEIRLPPEAQFGPELETIESVSAFKKIVDEGSRPR